VCPVSVLFTRSATVSQAYGILQKREDQSHSPSASRSNGYRVDHVTFGTGHSEHETLTPRKDTAPGNPIDLEHNDGVAHLVLQLSVPPSHSKPSSPRDGRDAREAAEDLLTFMKLSYSNQQQDGGDGEGRREGHGAREYDPVRDRAVLASPLKGTRQPIKPTRKIEANSSLLQPTSSSRHKKSTSPIRQQRVRSGSDLAQNSSAGGVNTSAGTGSIGRGRSASPRLTRSQMLLMEHRVQQKQRARSSEPGWMGVGYPEPSERKGVADKRRSRSTSRGKGGNTSGGAGSGGGGSGGGGAGGGGARGREGTSTEHRPRSNSYQHPREGKRSGGNGQDKSNLSPRQIRTQEVLDSFRSHIASTRAPASGVNADADGSPTKAARSRSNPGHEPSRATSHSHGHDSNRHSSGYPGGSQSQYNHHHDYHQGQHHQGSSYPDDDPSEITLEEALLLQQEDEDHHNQSANGYRYSRKGANGYSGTSRGVGRQQGSGNGSSVDGARASAQDANGSGSSPPSYYKQYNRQTHSKALNTSQTNDQRKSRVTVSVGGAGGVSAADAIAASGSSSGKPRGVYVPKELPVMTKAQRKLIYGDLSVAEGTGKAWTQQLRR
jgi:hypothetical protein